jgi:hypothetical protein
MSSNEGNAFMGAEVGEPIPGEQTFDADDEILPIRRNRLEKRLGCRLHMAVKNDLSISGEDAEVHRSSVEVDATVKCVLFRVEAHEVSSS